MKFLILALACAAVASAQQYAQQPIAILRHTQDISPDGSYNYAYETEHGIVASETGSPGPLNEDNEASVVAQGSFQYTAPDGTPISVSYVADENGFQPQGAHLPVAPAIPAQIQRALDYIASRPSQESRSGPQARPGQGFRQF